MAEMEKTNLETEELDAVSGGCGTGIVTQDERPALDKFLHQCLQDDRAFEQAMRALDIEDKKVQADIKKAWIGFGGQIGSSFIKAVGDVIGSGQQADAQVMSALIKKGLV